MVNPEVQVVSDWDEVQYKTRAFKDKIFAGAQRLSGLPVDEVEELYKCTKDADGYNDVALAEAIAKQTGADAEAILNMFRMSLEAQEISDMYEDALEFNLEVSKRYPLSIYTAGPLETQQRKIRGSGQGYLFSDIKFFPQSQPADKKAVELQNLYDATQAIVVYIDDEVSNIMRLHEIFQDVPKIVPILLDRSPNFKPGSPLTWNKLALTALEQTIELVKENKIPHIIGLRHNPKTGHSELVAETEN